MYLQYNVNVPFGINSVIGGIAVSGISASYETVKLLITCTTLNLPRLFDENPDTCRLWRTFDAKSSSCAQPLSKLPQHYIEKRYRPDAFHE